MPRWGVFNRPLTVALTKWGFLADVCARLHNFCIRLRQGEPPTRMACDVQTGDVPQVIINEERHNGSRLEGLRRTRRQEITQTLAERGVVRP